MPSIEHGPDAQPVTSLGPAPVVQTPAGAVRGVLLGPANAAYLGIPYAEAPVGDLRYAAPVKRAPWTGVRDASRYGATPLRDYMTGVTLIPEPSFPGDDTLLVNVFTPRPGDADAKLPVHVWIHGGGFLSGSPSSSWYDGGAYARDGVVVVSVSYRLGFDGFGVLRGAPDNRAVRDWILALEWVRDSIAQFGGDPARVTVGGQSAGGSAALTLLAVPSAQHLFTGVIAESPGLFTGDRGTATRFAEQLADDLGVEATRDAFAALPEQRVFEAQKRRTDATLGAGMLKALVAGTATPLLLAPVVDGDLLPRRVETALAAGIGAGKTLLIGATADEFDMAAARFPKALDRLPRGLILRAFGLTGRTARAYTRRFPGKTARTVAHLMTDLVFRCHVDAVLTARATARDAAGPDDGSGPGNTFAYDFRLANPDDGLAGHCIELPFVWDCLDGDNVAASAGPKPPQEVADLVHAAWVRMIADGDPGWPAFDPVRRRGLLVDDRPRVEAVFGDAAELNRGLGRGGAQRGGGDGAQRGEPAG